MKNTIDKIKQLLPDKPNTIHHDIEYVELVNKIKKTILEEELKQSAFYRSYLNTIYNTYYKTK